MLHSLNADQANAVAKIWKMRLAIDNVEVCRPPLLRIAKLDLHFVHDETHFINLKLSGFGLLNVVVVTLNESMLRKHRC